MGKAFWFPTKWSAVRSRPGSKLLARRVARRGTPAFKALFPRRWELQTSEGELSPLVITQERPRHVPAQLFVYTSWPEDTLLARRAQRRGSSLQAAMWIDAHSRVQPCDTGARRAIHEWPAAWPAESEDAEWLGWAEDVKDLPSVIPLLNYRVDYCHYSLYEG